MDLMEQHLDNVIGKTWNFAGHLKTERDEILNAVLGLAGEAGEVADLHKKMFFHTHRDGRLDELKNELGDVCYYLFKVMDLYGFTMADVLEANKEKLFKRHADTINREAK